MLRSERNTIESDKFTLCKLLKEEDFCCDELTCFDCGKNDLNEFFRKDALAHKNQLLAETYYFQPREATEEKLFVPVAFVSFLNDSIEVTREERKAEKIKFWKYIRKSIPHPKHLYESFPAVKIGRLGVIRFQQRKHFGTSLVNMAKSFFLTDNRTGCRFITVDAYNDEPTKGFYQKNGFQFLWEKDANELTRIMYFDLMRHENEN